MTNDTQPTPHITGVNSDLETGGISFASCIEGNRMSVINTTKSIVRSLGIPFKLNAQGNNIMLTLTYPTSGNVELATNAIKRVYAL